MTYDRNFVIIHAECQKLTRKEFHMINFKVGIMGAGKIAGETGAPPPTKLRKNRLIFALKLVGAALCGAAAALLVSRFLM